MRYGKPTIGSGVANLLAAGVDELLLIPMYPHHADSTRTTSIEAVEREISRQNSHVSVVTLPPFYDEPHYIDALTHSIATLDRRPIRSCCCSATTVFPNAIITRADPTGSHCLKSADCCERAVVRARDVLSASGIRNVTRRSGAAWSDEQSMARQLSIAPRPAAVAAAVYRSTARNAAARRHHAADGGLPGVRGRQPRNAGGDRHHRPRAVPGGRRRIADARALPE